MSDYDPETLEAARRTVYAAMAPTPQYAWPLLAEATGCETWVKHENHSPIGAFKVRGGLVYLESLARERPDIRGVVSATRGNHGQSIAFAARRAGIAATIVVPRGNSREKNAAMRAFGVELVEHGRDFNEALDHAKALAAERGLHMLPSFHRDLVRGVASYSLELLEAVPDLDTLYVPIGMGSGCCGAIAARDALGLKTRIVGVVAERAPCYLHSFAMHRAVPSNSADTFADGLAVRVPSEEALAMLWHGCERVVAVPEEAMEAAMRLYFTATHNLAEGAGAAALAALMAERDRMSGRKVAVVLSGGNIDRELYRDILGGRPDGWKDE